MLTTWLRRKTRAAARAAASLEAPAPSVVPAAPHCAAEAAECPSTCPLNMCARGHGALVVRVACPTPDACRLRALGVYEGARVNVVDSRNGLLLEVRGSRIALGGAVAASIAVVPLPA